MNIVMTMMNRKVLVVMMRVKKMIMTKKKIILNLGHMNVLRMMTRIIKK